MDLALATNGGNIFILERRLMGRLIVGFWLAVRKEGEQYWRASRNQSYNTGKCFWQNKEKSPSACLRVTLGLIRLSCFWKTPLYVFLIVSTYNNMNILKTKNYHTQIQSQDVFQIIHVVFHIFLYFQGSFGLTPHRWCTKQTAKHIPTACVSGDG